MTQSHHHFYDLSLDSFQYAHGFLLLGSPELDTTSPVLSREEGSPSMTCWQHSSECYLPLFQDDVGLLCLDSALLSHNKLVVHPDISFCFYSRTSPSHHVLSTVIKSVLAMTSASSFSTHDCILLGPMSLGTYNSEKYIYLELSTFVFKPFQHYNSF